MTIMTMMEGEDDDEGGEEEEEEVTKVLLKKRNPKITTNKAVLLQGIKSSLTSRNASAFRIPMSWMSFDSSESKNRRRETREGSLKAESPDAARTAVLPVIVMQKEAKMKRKQSSRKQALGPLGASSDAVRCGLVP